MTIQEIIMIVMLETGVFHQELVEAEEGLAYDAKCIICMMAEEEGMTNKEPVARLLRSERGAVYYWIKRTDRLLSYYPWSKVYDKEFKNLYLRCNKRRSYFEERPELKLSTTFLELC